MPENNQEKIRGGYEDFAERGGFDDIYVTYDLEILRYFLDGAKALIDELAIEGTESILDIGTGTGHTSIELAKRYPNCSILGIDMSDGMLNKAIEKKGDLKNIEFKKHDWEKLQDMEGSFDLVTNSFGISFIKNVDKFADSVNSKLKKHSRFAFVNFDDSGFMPFSRLMYEDLVKMQIEMTYYDSGPARDLLVQIMNEKGFATKKVVHKDLKYKMKTSDDWWTIVTKSIIKENFIYNASEEKIEDFKTMHLKHVQELIDVGNNVLSIPVTIYVTERASV